MNNLKHLALTVLVALVSSVSASAYDFEYNGLYYKITTAWNSNQNTCEVTYGPSGKDNSDYTLEDVVVPEGVAYGGSRYLVTSIGEYAFYKNNSIKTLKVEGNVTKIGEYAFYSCSNLTSVQLNESVKNIGKAAFCNDYEVSEFKMPGVEVVGSMALGYLKKLKTLEIPACTRHFPADAIPNLQSLEEIIVSPDNPYFMAENGILYTKDKKHIRHFPEASRLTDFSMPEGVEEIDTLCFFWSGLRKITVPNTVKKIRCRAFGSCYNLEELSLPQSVEEMGEYATFIYCPKLKQIVVPNNVKRIENSSYIDLVPNLETVVFGESVTSFPYNCIRLYGSSSEGIPDNDVYKNTIILSKTVPTNWDKLPGTKWVRRELSLGSGSYRSFEYIFNNKPYKNTWYEAYNDFTGLYCVGDTLFAFSGNSKRTKPSDMGDYASKSDYKYNPNAEFYYHNYCIAFDFSKSGVKASDFVGKKIHATELIGTPVSNIDECGLPCYTIYTTPQLDKYDCEGEEFTMNTYRVINFAYPADDGNGYPYYLVKPVIGERCKVTGTYYSSKGGFYDSSLDYIVRIRGAKDLENYRTYTLEGVIRYITTESSYSGGYYVLDVSGDINFDYEISKQPTENDLSVELNKPNAQTEYQWYQMEDIPTETKSINFEYSYSDWSYTWINGSRAYQSKPSGSYKQYELTTAAVEVEPGDTLTLKCSIVDGGSLSVYYNNNGKSVRLEQAADGTFTYVFTKNSKIGIDIYYSNKYPYQGYVTVSDVLVKKHGKEGVALKDAILPKLSEEQFIDGKSVYCIVSLPHGQKLVSDTIQTRENFIAKQPTALDLSVELSMPTDKATYQWYKEIDEDVIGKKTIDISSTLTSNCTYPWTLENGIWTSGNKGKSSSSSTLTLECNLNVDEVLKFDCSVSSESDYDELKVTSSLGSAYSWTASGSNKTKSYEIEGNGAKQTWTFVYSKDGSVNSNDDCAKVYNIKKALNENEVVGTVKKQIEITDATNSTLDNLTGLLTGDVVFCEITLPNGRMLQSERVTLNDYSFGSSRTITYIVNGNVFLTEEYEIGSTITAPEPPTIEGYTFVRWENLPDVMPVNDLTVTAVYKENKCKIYNGNNHVINSRYTSLDKKPDAATAANALVFVDESINENVGENFVMKNADNNWRANSIVLSDAQPFYNPVDVEAESINYVRNFTSTNLQALYLPYAMSYDDWKDKAKVSYINDVHQFDDDDDGEIDRTVLEFISVKSGELAPNIPYLIKPLEKGETTFTSINKTLKATLSDGYIDCSSTRMLYTLTGTYQTRDDIYANGYYAMSGGSFKVADNAGVTLSPFRIFLSITNRYGNGAVPRAKKITIMVDGVEEETTDIDEIMMSDAKPTEIYNLQGVRVNEGYKGIVIKNGRKVLVK